MVKVYRWHRNERKPKEDGKNKQIECLRNYWAYEEQLGIRKKPEDSLLNSIPKIKLKHSVVTDHIIKRDALLNACEVAQPGEQDNNAPGEDGKINE